MATATLPKSVPTCSNFPKILTRRARPRLSKTLRSELTDRQERLAWWNQAEINTKRVLVIGAGGLGGNAARTLVQMGIEPDLVDHDIVEASNLNRQFFTVKNLGMPKPHALGANIAPFAARPMTITSYWMGVGEFAVRHGSRRYDLYLVGVDNDPANAVAAWLAHEMRTPAVFINVSRDGEACRVFVQRTEGPCFLCYKPRALDPPEETKGCPRTPAIADILQVAAGVAVRAVAGELLGVPIGEFNCRDLTLSGFDYPQTVKRRPTCPVCAGDQQVGRSLCERTR